MKSGTPNRILFDVSGHGLGHLAISAPVIVRLKASRPSLEVIVRTCLPESRVRSFVGSGIPVLRGRGEVTPRLLNAVTTDIEGTAADLRELTLRFDAMVAQEREALAEIAPDLVVCNVSYLTLAAAQAARIRNLALCCMNWADIFASMEIASTFSVLIRRLQQIYEDTECFLQPAPHMDMPALPNRKSIGPISRCGTKQGARLAVDLGVSPETRIVLYSLGGIPGPTEIFLPVLPNTHWIVTDPRLVTRV